jgi:adenylate cyclase
MPDLIAQGPQPEHRWRRRLLPGVRQTIGRQAGDWSVPWDERISRRHAELEFQGGELRVEKLESARNPIFFQGHGATRFSIKPGEHFVIGDTTFSLVDQRVNVSLDLPEPANERTFSTLELRREPFRESDKRIDVLSRLPDVISGSSSDEELFTRLVNLLLRGIERATAAAVVAVEGFGLQVQGSDEVHTNPQSAVRNRQSHAIRVLHWDRRVLADAEFRPSERLIRQAVESGESVVHVWSGTASSPSTPEAFTLSEGSDWALCAPVPGKACRGWALYVSGNFSSDFGAAAPEAELLRDDVKFAELMATTLGGLRESQLFAARQASLSQFFSPSVLEIVGDHDPDVVLAPREADVTVLFCDLRGFSRESERSAGDLFGLLERVSQALGVMTHHILQEGGVIGDFHGDAAMGFWGWPLAQSDAAQRACRAALGIRAAFADASNCDSPNSVTSISDFHVGIGIASGSAVAGKIGSMHQVKVTVFGPVVNLAARLETMTRQTGASILLDRSTAEEIAASMSRDACRVRPLAKVRPIGFSSPVEVSELLPPATECPGLPDENLAAYAAALSAFASGDWGEALEHLSALPVDDQAAAFLEQFIGKHGGSPPMNWDGTIPLEAK